MLSATVSQGKDVYFWKTMPRSRPGPPTGLPSTRISPVSGWSRPAIMRSSVDFPQPDGPSRTLNSPRFRPSGEKTSSTSKLTLCSASMRLPLGPAKLRERLRTEILVLFMPYLAPLPCCTLFLVCLVAHALACRGELQFAVQHLRESRQPVHTCSMSKSLRRLPHVYPEGAWLFVTWHLHGSLPKA